MSKEIGFACGKTLDDYFTELRIIENNVRDEIKGDVGEIDQQLGALEGRLAGIQRTEEHTVDRLQKVIQHRAEIEGKRESSPSEFSSFIGRGLYSRSSYCSIS